MGRVCCFGAGGTGDQKSVPAIGLDCVRWVLYRESPARCNEMGPKWGGGSQKPWAAKAATGGSAKDMMAKMLNEMMGGRAAILVRMPPEAG